VSSEVVVGWGLGAGGNQPLFAAPNSLRNAPGSFIGGFDGVGAA